MKKYKSQSTIYPIDVDTANDNVVLVNQNVSEIEATEETPKMYEYDVIEYTKDEYSKVVMAENVEKDDALIDVAGISSDNTDASVELADLVANLEARVKALEEK